MSDSQAQMDAERQERAWNKNITLWQAGLATFSLLVMLGGLLLAGINKMSDINMGLHDLNQKLAGYDKVQERVTSLESWRWQRTSEDQANVASIVHLTDQLQRHEDRLQDLGNKIIAVQTSAQDRNREIR